MEDVDNKKKSKKGKVVGFVVLALLFVIGFIVGFKIYELNKPYNIYSSLINSALKSSKFENHENYKVDFKFNARVKDSELDDTTKEILNSMNYSGTNFISVKEKYMIANYTIKNDSNTLLDMNMYYKNGITYLGLGELFDKLIEIPLDEENSKKVNDLFLNINSSNIEVILREIKNAFEDAIKDEKIVKEKTTLDIDGKSVNVVNNKLVIDKSNEERISKKLSDYLKNSDDFLDNFSKEFGVSKEDIISFLEDDSYTSEEDYKMVINLYTNGFLNNFVSTKIEFIENDEKIVNFEFNKNSIKISDDDMLVFTIKEDEKDKYSINLKYELDGMNVELSGTATMSYAQMSTPFVSNSVSLEELTEEDFVTFGENLSKNEAFINIIEKYVGPIENIQL